MTQYNSLKGIMDTESLRKALAAIQKSMKEVERFEFDFGPDSGGDPAIWVWVVMKTEPSDRAWSWENRERIRSTVREGLKKVAPSDWVYVRFRGVKDEAPSPFVSST